MDQFEVFTQQDGVRRLFVVDLNRYSFWYGFRRFIKELP